MLTKLHSWITHTLGLYSPSQHLFDGCECQSKYFEWRAEALEMARSLEAKEIHD